MLELETQGPHIPIYMSYLFNEHCSSAKTKRLKGVDPISIFFTNKKKTKTNRIKSSIKVSSLVLLRDQ